MCPISATTLLIAGAAVSAVGAISAGQAQANASKYQANIATQNANAAQQQAQQAALLQEQKTAQLLGTQRAGYGGSGITSEGSPLDVLSSTASAAELDRQTILYQGHIRAAGYQDDATLARMAGDAAVTNSYFSATGAILNAYATDKARWVDKPGSSPGAGLGAGASDLPRLA